MVDRMLRASPRLLALITDNGATKTTDGIIGRAGVHLQYRCLGHGTVGSEVMDYLGLGSQEKAVTLCALPRVAASRLLEALSEELVMRKPGSGIAFTVPLSGVSSPVMKLLDEDVRKELHNRMESEMEDMKENASYSLVLAAVNQGFSEEVMAAARPAGATGGTVIHARRLGMEDTMQFWGITLQSEKEIVLIVAERENKVAIMRAIGEKCGFATEAQGMVMSLPVDEMAGLARPLPGAENNK